MPCLRLVLPLYSLLLATVRQGHCGVQECHEQFKHEIWNCPLNSKQVHKDLPIFVKTSLPYGKICCCCFDMFVSPNSELLSDFFFAISNATQI